MSFGWCWFFHWCSCCVERVFGLAIVWRFRANSCLVFEMPQCFDLRVYNVYDTRRPCTLKWVVIYCRHWHLSCPTPKRAPVPYRSVAKGFPHRQGSVRFSHAGVKILMRGPQIRGFHVGDARLGGVRIFDARVKIQHDAQWSVLTRASIFWRARHQRENPYLHEAQWRA